ncbi:GNAT family N-acetyltransferase [Priestia aryabhattai]|uniref:GNAT family N-acetyltransferase n=1 Tax=Priestia aryabhattai TaxID=412384 RepID=UPI0039820268
MINKDFSSSTEKSYLNIDTLHEFLSKDKVIKSINNSSICFGLCKGKLNQKLIGFARVITNMMSFGCLTDVFILNEYRGKGLGICF